MTRFFKKSQVNIPTVALNLIFYCAVYLYIIIKINPLLYYQNQSPVFLLTDSFFYQFLTYPGGLTEYLNLFFSQFYLFPVIAACIITLTIWLICYLTKKLILLFRVSDQINFIHFIPAILLLSLQNQYSHTLAINIALIFSLIISFIFIAKLKTNVYTRFFFYLGFIILLYYLAGGPFYLYVVIAILLETILIKQKTIYRYVLSFLYIASALLLPYYAAKYCFLINITDTYTKLFAFNNEYSAITSISSYILYIFYPFIILGLFIYRKKFKIKVLPFFRFNRIGTTIKFFIKSCILFLFTYIAAFSSFDQHAKIFYQVDYYAQNRYWDKILQYSENELARDPLLSFHFIRAMYHTGRFPYDMFSFHKLMLTKNLFLTYENSVKFPLQNCDFNFELGSINEAQHWAHEALTMKGPTIPILKKLILLYIIKDEKKIAWKYMKTLNQIPFNKEWVDYYSTLLEDNSLLEQDSQLKNLMQLKVDTNIVIRHNIYIDEPDYILHLLLKANKSNKMAFEYLMAYYLLDANLEKFAENVYRLIDFGYYNIPNHYEEAVVLYMVLTGRLPQRIQINTINPATFVRFKKYQKILANYNGNKQLAHNELFKGFRNSYWYYCMYKSTNPIKIRKK
jgi:hypothetical protein